MSANRGSKLFLSYRRDDAEGQAGRLYDRLNGAFPGRVFRDVSGIDIGVDFSRAIHDAMSSSAAVIAVIGKQWLTLTNPQGQRRIFEPHDYVRQEISTAIERNLRLIPVLVDGARMPAAEDLPPDIQTLARIQAIELTMADYDHLVERLIHALEASLGKAGQPDDAGGVKTQVETLLRRAEASIALEDWLGAIQALKSARSLDPGNAALAARLRFAQDQLQLSGLYADGQRRYQNSDKRGALERFRQVRAAGGSYKNVDQLISQLESELRGQTAPPPPPLPGKKKASWIPWTVGGVTLLVVIGFVAENLSSPTPQPSGPSYIRSDAPQPAVDLSQMIPPSPDKTAVGESFSPSGRWDLSSEVNPAYGMLINFSGGQFAVQTRQGYMSFPGSGGTYQYDAVNHLLVMTGLNNMGIPFREAMQILGPHGDHIHVLYNNTQWAMRRAQY
jgi:TIR domain